MPLESTIPRMPLATKGLITQASEGPSFIAPTSGLMTVPPCTSWS